MSSFRHRTSSTGLVLNDKMLFQLLSGYLARVSEMRAALKELASADWVIGYELSGWVHNGVTVDKNYHVFSISLPANFDDDENNEMYMDLCNLKNFAVEALGEVAITLEPVIEEPQQPLLWGFNATGGLLLFVPIEGMDEDKYIYWLPEEYTQEEYDLFFDIHRFTLDYKRGEE